MSKAPERFGQCGCDNMAKCDFCGEWEVCKSEDCCDESCEFFDGRWACSRECYDAIWINHLESVIANVEAWCNKYREEEESVYGDIARHLLTLMNKELDDEH